MWLIFCLHLSKLDGRLVFILFTSYTDHAAKTPSVFLEMFLKFQSNYVEVRYSPWMIDHKSWPTYGDPVLLFYFSSQNNSTDIFNEDKSNNKGFFGGFSIPLFVKFYSLFSCILMPVFTVTVSWLLRCFLVEDCPSAVEFSWWCSRGNNSASSSSTVTPLAWRCGLQEWGTKITKATLTYPHFINGIILRIFLRIQKSWTAPVCIPFVLSQSY